MLTLGRLEVTWGFAVVPLLALWLGAGSILPVIYISSLCHELGHLAALALAGAKVEKLRLSARGAELHADTRFLPYGREILCSLAGPMVNVALALFFSRCMGNYLFGGANLLLALFNLLPVPSLDGGRILFLSVSWAFGPWAADTVCRVVGLLTAVLLTAGAFVLFLRYHGGFFLVLAALGVLLPQIAPCQTIGNRIK